MMLYPSIICIVLAMAMDQMSAAKVLRDVCTGQPDGFVPSYGCRSYEVCYGEQPSVVDCHAQGLVFNPDMGQCDSLEATAAPCGLVRDCGHRANGRYADHECRAFFTCHGGVYLGHNPCPAGLVFDEALSLCNWQYAVPPPCGTKMD